MYLSTKTSPTAPSASAELNTTALEEDEGGTFRKGGYVYYVYNCIDIICFYIVVNSLVLLSLSLSSL